MNIVREQPAKTTVKLKIEIPVVDLKPFLDKAVKRISQEVKIPGFRPGHVTYEILKNKIGEMDIYQEAARLVIDATLPQAVQKEKIDFVGQPNIAIEQVAPGNALIYTAEFALMPTVTLKDYKKISAKKKPVTVDEKKYKQTLEQLRKMQAVSKPVERAAKTGDKAVIEFAITLAGVAVEGGQGKHVPVTLGEHTFIPGFEEQLVGMKAKDTKNFKVTFPKEYGTKHLAGRECDVTATVEAVQEVTLPELNDALAKTLKFNSLTDLEKAIRENIAKELEQEANRVFETAIIEDLIKQGEFDPIPEPMLQSELDRMLQELKQEIEQQGAKYEDYLKHIKKTEAELRTAWKTKAEQRIKGALILKLVGELEKVEVSEAEIDEQVKQYQTMYKDAADYADKINSLEFRSYVRTVKRNDKVMEALKKYAAGDTKK
ncbi:MAG: trigger factor [Patescibacteria group bacterium]|jgi:trigger factor